MYILIRRLDPLPFKSRFTRRAPLASPLQRPPKLHRTASNDREGAATPVQMQHNKENMRC